jgi:hypothetical protein
VLIYTWYARAHHHEPWSSQDILEEVIIGVHASFELASRPHHRVDLSAQLILSRREAAGGLAQSDTSHHQQVDVTSRLRGGRSDRPEDEGELDPCGAELIPQHVSQAVGLEHNLAQRAEQRVPFVCLEVPSIAVPPL